MESLLTELVLELMGDCDHIELRQIREELEDMGFQSSGIIDRLRGVGFTVVLTASMAQVRV